MNYRIFDILLFITCFGALLNLGIRDDFWNENGLRPHTTGNRSQHIILSVFFVHGAARYLDRYNQ